VIHAICKKGNPNTLILANFMNDEQPQLLINLINCFIEGHPSLIDEYCRENQNLSDIEKKKIYRDWKIIISCLRDIRPYIEKSTLETLRPHINELYSHLSHFKLEPTYAFSEILEIFYILQDNIASSFNSLKTEAAISKSSSKPTFLFSSYFF
jgi:hypothetical protein